jgi:hypothetical protein
MESYNLWPVVSGFFYLAQCFQIFHPSIGEWHVVASVMGILLL